MKVLITGSQGQVGSELTKLATKKSLSTLGLNHQQLDITDAHQITKAITEFKPDVVINTAAYTAVDKAESEQTLSFAINCEGPRLLAKTCAQKNIPLIHLSTDYVFSGNQTVPYIENDAAKPINIYGQSKLAGEIAVRQECEQHLILRLSSIFSPHGHNFVKTILRLAEEKEELRVVNDQINCPTYAVDIAQAIIYCCENLQNNLWGTYHFCSFESCSWFHFAESILQQAEKFRPLKLKKLIAIPSTQYQTAAKRPAYSALNCDKLQSTWQLTLPAWQISLEKVMRELM